MPRRNPGPNAEVIALTNEVRQLFHRLAIIADNLHEEAGITAAMRAVLESLNHFGPQTVPQIAEQKSVSRQHIQIIANHLDKHGLVNWEANPKHKRSLRMRLSGKGKRLFEELRAREEPYVLRIAAGLSAKDIAIARSVLAKMIANTMQ